MLELDIPNLLEQIWRVGIMLMASTLAGKILFGLISKNSPISRLSNERRWAWFGVLIFIFQNIAIQIDRFNSPVTVFGSPLSTLAILVFWIAYQKLCNAERADNG